MKLNLDESDTDSAYVIDLTSVETNKPTTEVREQKYANRKVKGILKQVPRLSLLAAQALFLDK